MNNQIKDHIDKLFRKRIKDAVDAQLDKEVERITEELDKKAINKLKLKIKKELEVNFKPAYEYAVWLKHILSTDLSLGHFPRNQHEEDLFQLLTLEVLYKQTLKSACDDDHPIAIALLEDIELGADDIRCCIDYVKAFSSQPLEFYLLFEDELQGADYLVSICEKIDQLSEDAKHGTIVSHPAKMTNPECRFPKLFASSGRTNDGFVRSGNAPSMFDIHINAVNLKVFKFVSLVYNGKRLLEYIRENNTEVFKAIFRVTEEKASKWIRGFSECINNVDKRTNNLVRQTYFPVSDGYHLLSLLTPSGLVFALKDKIDYMNDRSPTSYSGKRFKKNNKYQESGFSSIIGLTMTRHGGEHPKNISGLNNQYQSYYLLSSAPPILDKRAVRFPKHNFFGESLRNNECRDVFDALHKLFLADYNNKNIRDGRDYRLRELVDCIVERMWVVRAVATEQYRAEQSQLKPHQKVWLCDNCQQTREEDSDWLDKLCAEITNWIIRSYEKMLGKQAYKLGEGERVHIHDIVSESREALR